MPTRPEQSSAFQVPQLERAIIAPGGEPPLVRAEREGLHCIRMRLPGQMQPLTFLTPHPHFSPPAACCPVASSAADGHGKGDIKGGSPDDVAQIRTCQGSILHLYPLKISSSN